MSPSELPYGIHPGVPPMQSAEKIREVNTRHEIEDPILRAEMEGAAAAQAAAAQAVAAQAAAATVILPAATLRPASVEVVTIPVAVVDSRPFFLVSENNDKCVLDVHKENPKPGTPVGIYKKKTPAAPNQLWYIGDDGLLRSKLNDLVLTSHGSHKEIRTAEISGDARQQWIVEGNKIVNKMFSSECLTVKKGLVRYKDDAEVMAASYEGKPTQHWKQVYE